jgi:hypothetical protein
MASEFSGTDFSAGVFKIFANVIIILKTVKYLIVKQILSSQVFELHCLFVIICTKLTCSNTILSKLISVS